METRPLNVDNMNYDERLYLIKDLINLITDLEMHNITYGYLNYENLLYANGTLKMKVVPDPSHPDFNQMCEDRNILTLREGFTIILDRIMPYSIIPNGIQRDYNHFKRLTEFNLPLEMFRELSFHWVFMSYASKLRFASRASLHMSNLESDIWRKFNNYGKKQLVNQMSFTDVIIDVGFQLVYDSSSYDTTISSVITYWRNCEVYLNEKLRNMPSKYKTPNTKLYYDDSELGAKLCEMFPELIPTLWNFLFQERIKMDFHSH